jgi:UDP-N-acetylmuramyl pentapeptide phosphotransferase/UDP-N-acetylglucosamine-1-phosphate transferase
MAPIIAFMLLTILSYISVACIRRLALRYEILDKPNERSSHSIPMPRGGGLAIVFLVLAVSLWAANQVDINRSIIYIVLQRVKQMGENARAYLVKNLDRRDKLDETLKLLQKLVHA